MAVSRNSACPCGNGRKYKRCCLAEEKRAAREARSDDAVSRRIQDWSSRALGDDVVAVVSRTSWRPERRLAQLSSTST
jgi:uncharacterized protein YchJ